MSYEMRDCEAIYRSNKKRIKWRNKKCIKITEYCKVLVNIWDIRHVFFKNSGTQIKEEYVLFYS